MAFLLRGALAAMVMGCTAAYAQATDRTVIVFDASGSMWGQIDGKPKQVIARETLRSVLQSVPAGAEIGLIAYGHREKGSCEDIELVVPPAAGTAASIGNALDGMKFLGKTPLTASVRQAAEALGYRDRKATVILITDGVETCEADPCALGRELKADGADFTAHVVGFGLTAEEGREVACLAEGTAGRYLQATDAAGLADALAATVAAPEPVPVPVPEPVPEPEPAAETEPAPAQDAPAVAEPDPQPEPQPVAPPSEPAQAETEEAQPTTPAEPDEAALAADDGSVTVKVLYAVGGDSVDAQALDIRIFRTNPEGDGAREQVADGSGPNASFDLAPGDHVAVVRLDGAETEQRFSIQSGEKKDVTAVLNAGILDITAPGANEIAVFAMKPDADGERRQFSQVSGEALEVTLPAGDYVVFTDRTDGGEAKETPAAITAGGRTELTIP